MRVTVKVLEVHGGGDFDKIVGEVLRLLNVVAGVTKFFRTSSLARRDEHRLLQGLSNGRLRHGRRFFCESL